jgi:acetate kinase
MLIPRAGSRVCYLIPTDEELMIARHTLRVMYAHNAAMLEEKRA